MRDILGEFGEESPDEQAPRATNGGQMEVKKLPYSTPVGPKSLMDKGPGLHENNLGNCGTQK